MESRFRNPPSHERPEAADLDALDRAARDMGNSLVVGDVASLSGPRGGGAAITVRLDLSGASIDPQALALALAVTGGVLDAFSSHLSSPASSGE